MKQPVRIALALMGVALAITFALGALMACNSAPQATPTPTKTPRPEDNGPIVQPTFPPAPPDPLPTAAPVVTPVPTAAASPTAETASPTPELPTSTPEPTAPPEPTATPASANPSKPSSGAGLGPVPSREPGVSIFTGLRPADPGVLNRRPLAIKITNDADAQKKQSGLNKADVVVESRVEYSETRFTAIYQSQDTARVGPIRSARLIDVELPVIFDAVLAFSGGVEPVRQLLYNSDIGDHILEQARNGSSFYRDMSVGGLSWNTLFADTATLWRTSTQRGWNVSPQPSAAWGFSEAPPTGGASASRVDLPYPRFRVAWTYNPATGRWLRWSGGGPHMDHTAGEQVSAANVVVLGANHVVTLIVEDGTERRLVNGVCINCSIEIQLWGEGPLKILRDGKVYEGKWVRPERHAAFRFVDAQGRDIPLKPGNSWWQVVPLDMKVTVAP
ncbi:MAG: DUF3048 domain-containing protein [Anaerolineae bacterium]